MQDRQTAIVPGGDGRKGIPAESVSPMALWRRRSSHNIAKPLIEPGEKLEELLMRTRLEDENQARDVILAIDWVREFDLDEEEDSLRLLLAILPSIEGVGRKEYVMVATQILAPTIYGVKDGVKLSKREASGNGATSA